MSILGFSRFPITVPLDLMEPENGKRMLSFDNMLRSLEYNS